LSDGTLIVSTPITSQTTRNTSNPFHKIEWSYKDFVLMMRERFDKVDVFTQIDNNIYPYKDGEACSFCIAVCSGMKSNKVSIIIPTYNHLEDCLKPCLESIMKFTDMNRVEVIVVANGCTDGTREYVEILGEPFKLLWFDEPLGYPKAVNQGIIVAQHDYVLLLNNDIVLLDFQRRHGWINMLMEPFKRDSTIGITGPLKNYQSVLKQEFLVFFCVMIKKFLFEKFGLLDEKFGAGAGEDTDFCMKVMKGGYNIKKIPDEDYEVNAFPIYHTAGTTCHELKNWDEIIQHNGKLLEDRWVKNLDV
jgi:hypothetical protein